MKRSIAVVSIVLLTLLFVASAAVAAVDIKLAHVVNENDAFHVCALKFKELVEAGSKGELTVTIYPNAQLATSGISSKACAWAWLIPPSSPAVRS